jgi:hypothetical protein
MLAGLYLSFLVAIHNTMQCVVQVLFDSCHVALCANVIMASRDVSKVISAHQRYVDFVGTCYNKILIIKLYHGHRSTVMECFVGFIPGFVNMELLSLL